MLPLEVFAGGARPDRLALLIGSEGDGLSAEADEAADYRVSIPIRREIDSLKLAVATAIALSRVSPAAQTSEKAECP